jgi:hypothetical protein
MTAKISRTQQYGIIALVLVAVLALLLFGRKEVSDEVVFETSSVNPALINQDKDSHPSSVDCDDNDPLVYPGAKEICSDFKDNDCNGKINDGCAIPGTTRIAVDQDVFTYVQQDSLNQYNFIEDFVISTEGTRYYIDSFRGNDDNTGTAPNQARKSVAKLRTQELSAGDQVLFRKGSNFNQDLYVRTS